MGDTGTAYRQKSGGFREIQAVRNATEMIGKMKECGTNSYMFVHLYFLRSTTLPLTVNFAAY